MIGYYIGIVFGSITILIAFSALVFYLIKRKSSEKIIKEIGRTSEEVINKDIRSWAKITKNKFINSSLFKYTEKDQEKFFEVDSILITDKAIIVIEIKSIKGRVKGDASDETWTKIIGDKSFPLTNPIKQNDKHINHIERMTNIKAPTISLVVYSNRTSILDLTGIPSYAGVIRHADLFDTLDEINKSLPIKISPEEIKHIEKSIVKNIVTNKSDRKKFAQIVKGDN